MNHDHQFDELARHKLEERAFTFDEGAWLKAQQAISRQQRRRPKAIWYFAGITAIGLLAWSLWPAGSQEGEAAEQALARAQVEAGSVASEVRAADAEPSEVKPRGGEHAVVVDQVPGASDNGITTGVTGPKRTRDEGLAHQRPVRVKDPVPASQPAAWSTHAVPTGEREDALAEAEARASAEGDSHGVSESHQADAGVVASDDDEAASAVQPASAIGAAVATDLPPGGVTDAAVPPSSEAELAGNQAGDDAGSDVISRPQAIVDTGAIELSTQASPPFDRQPADSAAVALPEPLAPLVSPRSPWEISALAGLFSTTSRYQGASAQDWSVAPERNAAYGAEAMRMGRNFGYGIGLHYGTYADRLTTPEAIRTDALLTPYWFLQSIDTTVLVITGSTTDSLGNTVHTGISVPTTVQVLRSAFDTSYATSVVRQARTRVNRTSYIEVPLLMDAHLVQGRWSIGLRGGPTIGMLTTRSGSLPSEGNGGYAELGEADGRQVVFGWTARAYLRYRFNSAWSIGFEPSARGQLQDGVSGTAASRRSSGFGAALTLSYRLR